MTRRHTVLSTGASTRELEAHGGNVTIQKRPTRHVAHMKRVTDLTTGTFRHEDSPQQAAARLHPHQSASAQKLRRDQSTESERHQRCHP